MKLSHRLSTMAKEIRGSDRVVDIGSDHGYLPLILLKERGCSNVIVTDISSRSLSKAKKNIEKDYYGDGKNNQVSYRLGDGLNVISMGEANIAVIGGMGGLLISHILSQQIEIALSFDKIVMQPRKNQGELRYWLRNNGFTIMAEHLAQEGRFICEIIIAKRASVPWDGPVWDQRTKIQYQTSAQILQAEERNLIGPFLAKRLEQEKTVIKALRNLKNSDPGKRDVILYRIKYLENLIKEFEEGQEGENK